MQRKFDDDVRVPPTPRLQPVRIPVGWHVGWNTFYEADPTEETVRRGDFADDSLFMATHEHHRFTIEVAWRPMFDPAGSFVLLVLYGPWPRHPDGRRNKGEPYSPDWDAPVYRCTTRDRLELVQELEEWLWRCANWVRERN